MKKIIILVLAVFFVMYGSASAAYLDNYTNITINDEDYNGSGNSWYLNKGNSDDQETEPGTIYNQSWDLEGFYYNKNTGALAIVGGWNFMNGQSPYYSGDLFVDTNGGAQYGNLGHSRTLDSTRLNYGYEYAVQFNFDDGTWTAYYLDNNATLGLVTEPINAEASNPLKLLSGGTADFGGSITYVPGLSDSDVGQGLTGGTHYVLVMNDAQLPDEATLHFTMSCGNDNLMGFTPVAEPTTMLLLGLGLTGIAGLRRKFKK